jgi:hypothetical protein
MHGDSLPVYQMASICAANQEKEQCMFQARLIAGSNAQHVDVVAHAVIGSLSAMMLRTLSLVLHLATTQSSRFLILPT